MVTMTCANVDRTRYVFRGRCITTASQHLFEGFPHGFTIANSLYVHRKEE